MMTCEEMDKQLRAKQCLADCESFDFGPGWANIVMVLGSAIDTHVKRKRSTRARQLVNLRRDGRSNPSLHLEPNAVTAYVPKVQITYIKEKFGSLRVFYVGGDPEVDAMVMLAEMVSEVTCDHCGRPGKLTGDRWLAARCTEHA